MASHQGRSPATCLDHKCLDQQNEAKVVRKVEKKPPRLPDRAGYGGGYGATYGRQRRFSCQA